MGLILNRLAVFTYTSSMLDGISNQPGTYLLVFRSEQCLSIKVGRLGQLELEPGYYFYIGSAFGPGGLRARVRHHHGISTRPHWHLDYIRPALSLRQVLYSTDKPRYEHDWAAILYYTLQMQIPLRGLGSSDCQCESHFFYTQNKSLRQQILKALMENNNNLTISSVAA